MSDNLLSYSGCITVEGDEYAQLINVEIESNGTITISAESNTLTLQLDEYGIVSVIES